MIDKNHLLELRELIAQYELLNNAATFFQTTSAGHCRLLDHDIMHRPLFTQIINHELVPAVLARMEKCLNQPIDNQSINSTEL